MTSEAFTSASSQVKPGSKNKLPFLWFAGILIKMNASGLHGGFYADQGGRQYVKSIPYSGG